MKRVNKTPKSLFNRGNALLKQAKKERNPKILDLELETIRKYYNADIKNTLQISFALVLIAIYIITVASIVFTIIKSGYLMAGAVLIIDVIFASIISAIYLKACGKITEKGFLVILIEGFKGLFTFGKKS